MLLCTRDLAGLCGGLSLGGVDAPRSTILLVLKVQRTSRYGAVAVEFVAVSAPLTLPLNSCIAQPSFRSIAFRPSATTREKRDAWVGRSVLGGNRFKRWGFHIESHSFCT
jgi:hypothetical protein